MMMMICDGIAQLGVVVDGGRRRLAERHALSTSMSKKHIIATAHQPPNNALRTPSATGP